MEREERKGRERVVKGGFTETPTLIRPDGRFRHKGLRLLPGGKTKRLRGEVCVWGGGEVGGTHKSVASCLLSKAVLRYPHCSVPVN